MLVELIRHASALHDPHVHLTAGMDHLLHLGKGAGGSTDAESDELQMAFLMGLLSYLAGLPEVQRISPFHESHILNAVAGAIVQSGNTVDRPLTDAGLDGTDEVIQVGISSYIRIECFIFNEADFQKCGVARPQRAVLSFLFF